MASVIAFLALSLTTLLLLLQPAFAHRAQHHLITHAARRSSNKGSVRDTSTVIEHPVFFNMEDLLDNPVNESSILQGLNDLLYNEYSDVYFLYCGRVVQSKGVEFTHALVTRLPSVDALEQYYDYAIPDIVVEMWPWLKKEYCVDYEVEMAEADRTLTITKDSASYVTFIKASSNASDSDLKGAMDAFLALTNHTVQVTTGENLYVLEIYRTMSHAFTAYFSSVEDMEKWQAEPAVVSVLEDTILPLAESYAAVAVTPYAGAFSKDAHAAQ